jgi:beta-glucosidase
LYHWDLPQPLQDAGGWPLRDTAARFAEYAGIVAGALGDQVGMWITLNEPWCSAWLGYGTGHHAPGLHDLGLAAAAHHHLLLGHGMATQAVRAARPDAQVGISLNLMPVRPASDDPADVAAARRTDGNRNRLFLGPLFDGRYPQDMLDHYSGHAPGFSVIADGDLAVISAPADFLAINYYSPGTVADPGRIEQARAAGYVVPADGGDPLSADLRAVPVSRPDVPRTEMDWEVEPAALTELLSRVHREHPGVPLIVTENGAACADYVGPDGTVRDARRIEYLDAHVRAILRARESGVDVRGYFVWSLLDNFEWAWGYSKRFGLVWVDYPSGTRLPKDSFRWYRDAIHARTLAPVPEALARLRG